MKAIKTHARQMYVDKWHDRQDKVSQRNHNEWQSLLSVVACASTAKIHSLEDTHVGAARSSPGDQATEL